MGLKAISAGLSDVGRQREHNEDMYMLLPEHALSIVCDGMGGHRAGDVASKMAAAEVVDFFKTAVSDDITWPFPFDANKSEDENKLICGVKLANRKIFDKALGSREYHGMGTTVVGILYSDKRNQTYIAHVGDSRCYRVRSGGIEQLTRDHSLINEYLQAMPELPSEQRDNLPAADIGTVEEALKEGQEALKGEDVAAMEQARDRINQAAHKLAEAMYKQTAGASAAGPDGQKQSTGDAGARKRDGEVVDAEFEDVK